MCIGWARSGGEDLLEYRRRYGPDAEMPMEFRSLLRKTAYREDKDNRGAGQVARPIWNFLGTMRKRHWVLVPRRRDFFIGRVVGDVRIAAPIADIRRPFFVRDVEWLNGGVPIPKDRVAGAAELMRHRPTCEPADSLLPGLRKALRNHGSGANGFVPKSADEVVAMIAGGRQRKDPAHAKLLNAAEPILRKVWGLELLENKSVDLATLGRANMLVEAEAVTARRAAQYCIREAVGQLFEYSYFFHQFRRHQRCILLDCNPGPDLTRYVEQLPRGILLLWLAKGRLHAGPMTRKWLRARGISA